MGSAIPGDLNGDGLVNFSDLTPFAMALTDVSGYEATYPDLDRVALCDVSGDGVCNFNDLSPFANLLTGAQGNGQAVPEPTAGLLLLVAGVVYLGARGRAHS